MQLINKRTKVFYWIIQDVVEQTLHDIGIGSMSELHQMYRDRVVLYHARVRQESLQLYHQYLTLTQNREVNISTPGYVITAKLSAKELCRNMFCDIFFNTKSIF